LRDAAGPDRSQWTILGDAGGYRQALLAASQQETVVLVVQRGRARYYVTLSP